mgnify:CR=1 FL=1
MINGLIINPICLYKYPLFSLAMMQTHILHIVINCFRLRIAFRQGNIQRWRIAILCNHIGSSTGFIKVTKSIIVVPLSVDQLIVSIPIAHRLIILMRPVRFTTALPQFRIIINRSSKIFRLNPTGKFFVLAIDTKIAIRVYFSNNFVLIIE